MNVENSEKTEEVCEKTAQIHLKSGGRYEMGLYAELDDCEKIRDRLSLADPAAWGRISGRGKTGSRSGDIPCDHNKPSAEREPVLLPAQNLTSKMVRQKKSS